MRRRVLSVVLVFLIGSLTGCSYLFYPHAKEFTAKAKGATEVDTLINLTHMAEASAKAAKGGTGVDQPFDDLHNQFHAIDNAICCVSKDLRDKPAYALAKTQNNELGTIFKRLWKYKDDPARRNEHLDLFAKRVSELRESLQALR